MVAAVTVFADLSYLRVETVKLDYRDQCATVPFPNHQINFPITHSTFIINYVWTLINTDYVIDKTSACFFMLTT